MLQGNPFDTEKWVQERTQAVRQGVGQHGGFGRAIDLGKVKQQSGLLLYPVHRKVEGWWLPVAFILGTVLGAGLA